MYEFLCFLGNLLHFLVCCKCIVCPKRSELLPSRPNVQVRQNVPIQRPEYVISSDFEDDSTYNNSSTYGIPPITSKPKTVKHINPSGVTVSAKSLTVSNNEQFMHAVKVDFMCEVKGMVEVGGVPKEVKGMISIINNDDNSQIVSAVNTNLNRQSEEEYLEPVAVSKCVKITKRIGKLPDIPGRGADEGYESEKYGPYSSKDSNITKDESENLYEVIIESNRETPQENIPSSSSHDTNDSYFSSNIIKENKKETPKVENIPSSSYYDTNDSNFSNNSIKENKKETPKEADFPSSIYPDTNAADSSNNIIKENKKETPKVQDIPRSSYHDTIDLNSHNSKTDIKNKLETILSRQISKASSMKKDDKPVVMYPEVKDEVRNPLKSINTCSNSDDSGENIYENAYNDDDIENMSLCSSWASGEFDTAAEPIYGNSDIILKNQIENTAAHQSSSATDMNKEEDVSGTAPNKVYNMVQQIERNPSKSGTRTLIPIQKTETIEQYNDEHMNECYPSKSGTRTLIPIQKAETTEEYNEHMNERYPSNSGTRTLIPIQKAETIEDNDDEHIYEDIVINAQC